METKYPCHDLPQDQWCDRFGPGGFMGHTCHPVKPRLTKWVPETNPMILRRVGKTGEELAEAAKICSRITIQGIHGVDSATGLTNLEALAREVADVMAQCRTTIEALNLPRKFIDARVAEKQRQMAEWEAMFHPQEPGAPWAPLAGELVRYGDGSTALALHGEPHAGGWHGAQCMGGHTFYTEVHQPTKQDRLTWVECAVRWRQVSLARALQEAGLQEVEVMAI